MLNELSALIEHRKKEPLEGSYTCKLFARGEDVILKKVGEEAMEVILAAKGQGRQRLVEETSDLLYHLLVMLAQYGISLADVEDELRARHAAKSGG